MDGPDTVWPNRMFCVREKETSELWGGFFEQLVNSAFEACGKLPLSLSEKNKDFSRNLAMIEKWVWAVTFYRKIKEVCENKGRILSVSEDGSWRNQWGLEKYGLCDINRGCGALKKTTTTKTTALLLQKVSHDTLLSQMLMLFEQLRMF